MQKNSRTKKTTGFQEGGLKTKQKQHFLKKVFCLEEYGFSQKVQDFRGNTIHFKKPESEELSTRSCDDMRTLSNLQGIRIGLADWQRNERGNTGVLMKKGQALYPLVSCPGEMKKRNLNNKKDIQFVTNSKSKGFC